MAAILVETVWAMWVYASIRIISPVDSLVFFNPSLQMKTGSESAVSQIWPCYFFAGKAPLSALLLIYSFLNILSGKKITTVLCNV